MSYQQPSLISPPLSQSELEHHLWEAANILRGPVDAADFKTYIFAIFIPVTDEMHL
jgi:type I restriction enzyme M protein